jgi:hypothetical protein
MTDDTLSEFTPDNLDYCSLKITVKLTNYIYPTVFPLCFLLVLCGFSMGNLLQKNQRTDRVDAGCRVKLENETNTGDENAKLAKSFP